jgi:hypothetical protein
VRLAPKPGLLVLLHAPADVLQRRKREVSLAEAERESREYLQMFSTMPNSLVINAACPLKCVESGARERILSFCNRDTPGTAEVGLVSL